MKPITEPLSNADPASADVGPQIRFALLCIRAYQVLMSPYFGGSCRFLPSCSAYAAEAIATHGLMRGSWLASRRLVRCHPLCAAGHDPVPQGRVSGAGGRVSVWTSSKTRPPVSRQA